MKTTITLAKMIDLIGQKENIMVMYGEDEDEVYSGKVEDIYSFESWEYYQPGLVQNIITESYDGLTYIVIFIDI